MKLISPKKLEINKRIKVDFPHKFAIGGDVEQTSKTNQLVASAQRSVRPGRKTVRLTSSQVAIAKKLGVPLEEYAKQIKLTEGAKAYEKRNKRNFSCEPNSVKY